MARDAIARQYDVDKNGVVLDIPGGLISFQAKKGRSLSLARIHESIRATRLSGRTGMEVRYLELTVRGRVSASRDGLRLRAGKEEFALAEYPGAQAGAMDRVRAAAAAEKPITVTGRVPGWTGLFPEVLRAHEAATSGGRPPVLQVLRVEQSR